MIYTIQEVHELLAKAGGEFREFKGKKFVDVKSQFEGRIGNAKYRVWEPGRRHEPEYNPKCINVHVDSKGIIQRFTIGAR